MTEKVLADYNDVFADIVNAYFSISMEEEENKFQKVTPETLKDTRSKSIYKADKTIHEQERDVVKLWETEGVVICLLGLENQTDIDYDMPLRIFGYEGADYRKQLLNKNNEPYFVITIVLYYGTEKRWTAPLDLFGRIKFPDMFRPFVNNCKVNLLELAWLTDEQASFFKSDFRYVVDYLRQVRMKKDYEPVDGEVKHADELLKLMYVLTGDQSFERAKNRVKIQQEKGEKIMIKSFLKEAEEKGFAKGIAQGISQGILQGISQGRLEMIRDITERLIASGMSPEQVKKITQYPSDN